MSFREMAWDLVADEARKITDNNIGISFNASLKDKYLKKYGECREEFKNFMSGGDDIELDRHKNAAVIVCALSDASALSSKKEKGGPFFGNEILAVNVALSYMRESLQEQLRKCKEKNSACKELGLSEDEIKFIIENKECWVYPLPIPFSCPDHNYSFVLARDVYFSRKADKLFHLTLANIFYLIDVYAIQFYKRLYLE